MRTQEMKTQEMKTQESSAGVSRAPRVGSYIGSALGFVAWLVFGAIPGMLYGGYTGLLMAGILFGMPVESSWAAKILVGGGILLGLVASLFFFLAMSALAGAVIGFIPVAWKLRAPVEATAEQAGTGELAPERSRAS